MSDFSITPHLSEAQITLADEAWRARDELIEQASFVTTVGNPFEAEHAADIQRQIKLAMKQIEEAHRQAKAPVLEITRRIDGLKRDYCDQLDVEARRIARQLGEYQAAEERKRQAALELARREEQKRIDEMRSAEIARMKQAEREESIEAMAEDIAAIKNAAADDIALIRNEAIASTYKVDGIKTRKRIRWEIVDGAALVVARPDIVTPEPQTDDECKAPLKTRINAFLKISKTLPGVRVWEENSAII
jgi:hypothetical protein